MAVNARTSGEIDRPVDVVFGFWADAHAENHPRWDPHIELERLDDGPIQVGTKLKRRNSRSGTPVEGTMEVVAFERDRSVTFLIKDGPMEFTGGAEFESLGPERTKLTLWSDIPGLDEQFEGPITQAMEGSIVAIRELLDEET